MKKIYLLLLIFAGYVQTTSASVTPGDSTAVKSQTAMIQSFVVGMQNLHGKKLTLADKLKLKLVKSKYFKALVDEKGEPTEKQKKQGKLAMIFGIASIPLLFVPYVGLLAIPAAILAIILGAKSVKGNSNAQGIVGIVTGAISLFLVILAVIYVAAFFGA